MNPSRSLSRRTFLRASGLAVGLPWLEAMHRGARAGSVPEVPRRLVTIQTNMGILSQHFFPKATGPKYDLTPYLQIMAGHRRQFTVISGTSHPDVDGGHTAERSFLSAAPHPGGASFRNGISLDQFAAEQVGSATRFPSLTLAVTSGTPVVSVGRGGVPIPFENSSIKLYRQLFVDDKTGDVADRVGDLRKGRSVLDFVADSSRRLDRAVGAKDRQRLDQYYTSVRDLEKRMVLQESWARRPKPRVKAPVPEESRDVRNFVDGGKIMLDMVRLALETDSSRVVSFFLDGSAIHGLTHHGNRPETLAELRKVEESQFVVLGNFLSALSEVREGGDTLLDRTSVLYGSCMGNANSHSNVDLPILLAGGGSATGRTWGSTPARGGTTRSRTCS